MDKCSGQTEACMKANGKEAFSTESAVLFFLMVHLKKDTLRTMCTSIRYRLEVFKLKCVQRKQAQDSNQIHTAKIHISSTNQAMLSKKRRDQALITTLMKEVLHIKQNLPEMKMQTLETFNFQTSRFLKAPIVAQITQTNCTHKIALLDKHRQTSSIMMMDQQTRRSILCQDHN